MVSITGPLSFLLPEDAACALGRRAQERRLGQLLTRRTLAAQSGVPASTIRKFETTGQIGLVAMLQLADALGCLGDVVQLFPQQPVLTLDQFVAPKRRRGVR